MSYSRTCMISATEVVFSPKYNVDIMAVAYTFYLILLTKTPIDTYRDMKRIAIKTECIFHSVYTKYVRKLS